MIDVRLFRNDADRVRAALARRGKPDIIEQLDRAIALDVRAREISTERDNIRAKVNELSKKVGQARRDGDAAAASWLRRELPRRTRVNLRPVSSHDGTLVARVQRLSGSGAMASDLTDGLIAAGLADLLPQCQA